MIKMILAVDEENGIGKNGRMPWHHSEDFKHFKNYTRGSICIMGRTTFEDIKSFKKRDSGRFLPDRQCIVLTSDARKHKENNQYTHVQFMDGATGLIDILDFANRANFVEDEIFTHLSRVTQNRPYTKIPDISIVGGKSVYELFIKEGIVDEICLTRVKGNHNCDVIVNIKDWVKDFSHIDSKVLSDNCTVETYKKDVVDESKKVS